MKGICEVVTSKTVYEPFEGGARNSTSGLVRFSHLRLQRQQASVGFVKKEARGSTFWGIVTDMYLFSRQRTFLDRQCGFFPAGQKLTIGGKGGANGKILPPFLHVSPSSYTVCHIHPSISTPRFPFSINASVEVGGSV